MGEKDHGNVSGNHLGPRGAISVRWRWWLLLQPPRTVRILPTAGTLARRFCFSFLRTLFSREKTMSKKHKGGPAPIPKGNQSHSGPQKPGGEPIAAPPECAPASEQDPKRRLGNYDT